VALAPSQTPERDTGTVSTAFLAELRTLHDRGRTLLAFERATAIAPLAEWRGTEARLLAMRLLDATGASRQSSRIAIETWRADRGHPDARFYMAMETLRRRGALAALEFMDAQPVETARFRALRARVLGQLRDFEGADAALAAAEAMAPGDPWIQLERAILFERQDRYQDSLAVARAALSLDPDRPDALLLNAHVLQLLNRDEEAREILGSAAGRLQSAAVVSALALVQIDLELYPQARESYDQIAFLSPAMELRFAQWLCARRSDAAYLCGDVDAAIELARASQNPFHLTVAERMEKTRDGRRVRLPARFVRQHHMSCGPATLTAVSELWKMPADHLQVTEEICYDGTPAHSERRWAEENGWLVREFTVTWAAARTLLDRGIAFTLTTVEPGSAHLQAVIGYDERRGVLLLRDPFVRTLIELEIDGALERWALTGPRGMAMVPLAQRDLLDGLDLPDAAERDRLYRIDRALHAHDRRAAQAALAELEALSPGHLLAIHGRRTIAAYDGDAQALLECAEALLDRFPGDASLLLSKASTLRGLGRRAERVALLEEQGGKVHGGEPLLWVELASELRQDAREHDEAVGLLRRALRQYPSAPAFRVLGEVRWEQHRRREALSLFRYAYCLEGKNESHANAFFLAARALDEAEAALRVLRDRFDRFGRKSGLPARTLFQALDLLHQGPEAFAVLDRALGLREDDVDLLLYAADAYGRTGRTDRAQELLDRVEDNARGASWHRASAALAAYRCDKKVALEHWQAVLATEPLAVEAHEAIARLFAETSGRESALAHLESACARFPHQYRLHQIWLGWLRAGDPQRALPVAQSLVESHPADAWARRELAMVLRDVGRGEEAFAEIETAARLEPRSTSTFNVWGSLLERDHRVVEARERFRESLRLEIDQPWTIGRLLDLCAGVEERRVELRFVESEMRRQVVFGPAVLEFQRHAKDVLAGEEVLGELRALRDARPHLWEAWSASVHQLLEMERDGEALELAKAMVDRFPLLPATFRDLAAVHGARAEREPEKAALEQALRINPAWSEAARLLANAYVRDEQHERARELLERAIEATPLDPVPHRSLAATLWRLGKKEEALQRIQHALELEPDDSWAFGKLREWGGDAAGFARRLASNEPWSVGALLAVATYVPEIEERLAALAKAEERNARRIEIHDLRATVLAEAGRWEEAVAACHPAAFGDPAPVALRGREAWIKARRGDRRGAIAQLQSLVATEHDYGWGIFQLINLCREEGDKEGLLAAATRAIALEPRNAYAHGTAGEAKRLLDDRPGAKASLQRAIDLDPSYRWAGITLFDEQMQDGEVEAAATTLARLRIEGADPLVSARMVQIAARRGDREAAAQKLAEVLEQSCENDWPVATAVSAVESAGMRSVLVKALANAIDRPGTHPQAGASWLEHVGVRLPFFRLWPALRALRGKGEIGVRATRAYIHRLARRRVGLFVFLLVQGAELRKELHLWAAVGYALVTQRRYRAARRWLADYRARKPEAWMVTNAIAALQACRRDAEADAAIEFACSLPDAQAEQKLRVWNGFRSALAGDPAPARALPREDADTFSWYLRTIALAVAAAVDPVAGRAAAFREARKLYKDAAAILPWEKRGRIARGIQRRAVARIARARGGTVGFLWRFLRF